LRIPRFYINSKIGVGQTILLENQQHHHLAKVLRKKRDDLVTLFNGTGPEFLGKIDETCAQKTKIKIIDISQSTKTPRIKIKLGMCVLKREAMNSAITKCTELGVSEITPIFSDFCSVPKKLIAKKKQHWQKLAIFACEQSGLNLIPIINEPISMENWFKRSKEQAFIAIQTGKKLEATLTENSSVYLLIGPEGGFSQSELDLSIREGAIPVKFGDRILRAETAPIVAISMLYNAAGEF
tara:strand:+ start:1641 stop:2357 length:717 start_codon:yes stop_codon:yes gene_type:complete